MKIGIVLYPTYGGSGIVATELGKELAKKGHEVHFITYAQPVRLDLYQANIFYHEVAIFDYPLFDYQPYELALTSKLVDVTIHENLDILHVHYAIPHASAAYFAQQILRSKSIEIPFITTLHGTDITLVGKDPSFEPVITFSINNSNAVTVVSESLKQDTLNHFDITNDIQVIPNFIRHSNYERSSDKKCLRSEFAPNGEATITHISNFRKVKRVQDVLRIFKKISEKIPAKLLLVGDGPERMYLEQLCRELGICNDVKMVGKIQNVSEVLCHTDLFLLPSQTESFGLSALEALASSVPVISTNSGGLPEVNKDGYSGYLSDVGDIDDMAKKGISILKDPATLARFKKQAYAHSLNFSIEAILPQYEALYYKLTHAANVIKA
ncbi:N-acetyl-alpha-D-glucosaminyl L-malate synthase BshA [Putridiphycobacter roseus]|uniref:N-acetyl-alpha-D-glucosaminyl L-malate synthase BshA n=1 Tax=Putridiphycobacter roseus TaxID=2219161 RepID=A0A2W1N3A1_9FLAO|nr:N-acetyl-alpha-D-glucosaminyl L-malate synthase BshA [Putridiphycobacter roseus]PZE18040.1 N-acetyl-alpha-D-glucosaminyl L-malate synthase BshA [Putridiphycobacter roseus]